MDPGIAESEGGGGGVHILVPLKALIRKKNLTTTLEFSYSYWTTFFCTCTRIWLQVCLGLRGGHNNW